MPVLQPLSSGSTVAPQQPTQPSRKGKKAWRKNVDVSEVQKGLADLNDEIIRGGVVREKASSDLFALDTAGDSQISRKFPKHIKKGLKADEIINQRSTVAAVPMRKRPSDKTSDSLVPAKRVKADWVPRKELARLRRIADGEHGFLTEAEAPKSDVWAAPVEPTIPASDFEVQEAPAVKQPKTMKQQPVSLLATGRHMPAVPKPTGGYSYNPTFNDYEARLAEESQKALDTEAKRLDAEAARQLKEEAAAKSAAEAMAAEARADLSEWEEDSEWEGFQSGAEGDAVSAKRPGRKTQVQRNRIKRRKEEEQLAKQKAAIKAHRAQAQRIGEISQEVTLRENDRQLVLAESSDDSSEETHDDNKLKRRQIGKYKLPERDLELVLPDELEESLRLLKPEGNLLKDRYRSMLVRGKVETRRHIPFKRKANLKLTEKWTHKDFML